MRIRGLLRDATSPGAGLGKSLADQISVLRQHGVQFDGNPANSESSETSSRLIEWSLARGNWVRASYQPSCSSGEGEELWLQKGWLPKLVGILDPKHPGLSEKELEILEILTELHASGSRLSVNDSQRFPTSPQRACFAVICGGSIRVNGLPVASGDQIFGKILLGPPLRELRRLKGALKGGDSPQPDPELAVRLSALSPYGIEVCQIAATDRAPIPVLYEHSRGNSLLLQYQPPSATPAQGPVTFAIHRKRLSKLMGVLGDTNLSSTERDLVKTVEEIEAAGVRLASSTLPGVAIPAFLASYMLMRGYAVQFNGVTMYKELRLKGVLNPLKQMKAIVLARSEPGGTQAKPFPLETWLPNQSSEAVTLSRFSASPGAS